MTGCSAWEESRAASRAVALDEQAQRAGKRDFSGYVTYARTHPNGQHLEAFLGTLVEALGDFREPLPGSAKPGGSWAAAGEALAQIGPPAVPALRKGLQSSDRFVRRYSAEALGGLRDGAAPALPDLVALLGNDPWPDVREDCAWALSVIGPGRPEVVAALEKASRSDPEDFVRHLAADHLKKARQASN
jgi:HEAT repeat protein